MDHIKRKHILFLKMLFFLHYPFSIFSRLCKKDFEDLGDMIIFPLKIARDYVFDHDDVAVFITKKPLKAHISFHTSFNYKDNLLLLLLGFQFPFEPSLSFKNGNCLLFPMLQYFLCFN